KTESSVKKSGDKENCDNNSHVIPACKVKAIDSREQLLRLKYDLRNDSNEKDSQFRKEKNKSELRLTEYKYWEDIIKYVIDKVDEIINNHFFTILLQVALYFYFILNNKIDIGGLYVYA
ncbi:7919_t:CDS:2, partial [Dentiscutata heterogama]